MNYCVIHTSRAGQGLPSYRHGGPVCAEMPWLVCRAGAGPGGTAGGAGSTLWMAFKSQPGMSHVDAWDSLSSGVSFGCSKQIRDSCF